MKVKDIFDVVYGVNLELINCNETSSLINTVNFVSRTSENNGVVARVLLIDGVTPHEAGTISCAVSGSVLSTFVQSKPYYSGRDLCVLTPKIELKLVEKLFYCYVINANKYRYSYGRAANKTLKNIELPDEIPEWVYKVDLEKYYEKIKTNIPHKTLELDKSNWKKFQINKIFNLQNCKCSNASDLVNGYDITYIGAKKSNNGVMKYCKADTSLITIGNCIIFICDGQGSVGYSNYISENFIGSTTLTVGYNKFLNKYNGLFIVTIADMERYKFSFGRKYRNSLPTTKIKLPATADGNPDWGFMENFIKQLPYSDKI